MGQKKYGDGEAARRGFLGVDGAAAVEFAITAPMLVVLVLGIADYGLLIANSAALEGATRAGAEVAKANPSVTGAQLTAYFPSGITPTVTSVCTCVDNTWPNGAACPPPLTGVNACAAANGGNGITNPYTNLTDNRVLQYVQRGGNAISQPDRFVWDLYLCKVGECEYDYPYPVTRKTECAGEARDADGTRVRPRSKQRSQFPSRWRWSLASSSLGWLFGRGTRWCSPLRRRAAMSWSIIPLATLQAAPKPK